MTDFFKGKYPDWVISDTHWGHTNINTFCQRTTGMYPTPEAVDQLMVANWKAMVKPEDTVLHLGDLGWFDGVSYVPWLAELPGRRAFCRGNHDQKLSPEWLKEHGFTEIDPPTFTWDGINVLCTHYPQQVLAPNEVSLHGHCHNNPVEGLTRRHMNVSVELWHYAPVHGRWAIEKAAMAGRGNWSDFGPRQVKWREPKGQKHKRGKK